MATWSTGKNVTTGPLIIDSQAHVLGAGEYAPIKADIMPCSRHVKYGRIVIVVRPEGVPESELDPAAVAAWNETDALNAAEASGSTATPSYATKTSTKTSTSSTSGGSPTSSTDTTATN